MDNNRVVWRRRRPKRAAGRLGWTAFLAAIVMGPAGLIFTDEPATTGNDGAINPLALVTPVLAGLFTFLLVPQILSLVRQPLVSADHYALSVRPGVGRTLMLPWAQLAELALINVDEEPYLLVRCAPQPSRSGDWPRWWDQAHLRSARRGTTAASAYDLAVPMGDFDGTPLELLTELAQRAPDYVAVVSRAD